MDDSWNPFDDSDDPDDDRGDRDDPEDRADRHPFDSLFEFLSEAVDRDDFDGEFRFEVHSGGGGAAGLGPDRDPSARGRRPGVGSGSGAGPGSRDGMGPASRRGHPGFGVDPERVGAAAGGDDRAGEPDDGPAYEVREHDDRSEVIADVAGTSAAGGEVSTDVVDDRLVVVTDEGTLFEAALPAPGRVSEVVEHNGVLRVEVAHE
jgi:hypothetical protein